MYVLFPLLGNERKPRHCILLLPAASVRQHTASQMLTSNTLKRTIHKQRQRHQILTFSQNHKMSFKVSHVTQEVSFRTATAAANCYNMLPTKSNSPNFRECSTICCLHFSGGKEQRCPLPGVRHWCWRPQPHAGLRKSEKF